MIFGVSMLTNGLCPMGHPMHGFYAIGIADIIAPAMSHIELSAWSANRRAYAVTTVVSIAGIVCLCPLLAESGLQTCFEEITGRLANQRVSAPYQLTC